MTFAMTGGGTGGHVIPALAVAQEMKHRGHIPFFIGTKRGMESRLVPQAGFEIDYVEIGGLNRVGFSQKLRTLFQLPVGILHVWRLLGRRKPAALFSMGGYVAGPAVLAALLRGVPVAVMEPNAIPGLTNRRLARWTAYALVNFEETLGYFPPGRAEVSGVPVRDGFFQAPKRQGSFTILITGGSQGSRTLNEAGKAAWAQLARSGVRVMHQTGGVHYADYRDEFDSSGVEGEIAAFISDMPKAFAEADLVVCRAGASTVSELAAAGKPALLIPFPFAADNHQQKNAEAAERAGAARMILDRDCTGERLVAEVLSLRDNPERLKLMSAAAATLAKPLAAARAVDVMERLGVR